MSQQKRLALSAGDPAGIGTIIAEQALSRIGPKKNIQFLLWTDKNTKTIQVSAFKIRAYKSAKEALKSPFVEDQILQIKSQGGPGDWLKEMAQLCLKKKTDAIITGPVKKSSLQKTDPKALGQGWILKKLCKKELFMCFRGKHFNIVLLEDHIPLKKLSLNREKLKLCLKLSLKARNFLPKRLKTKPLALLGFNPHAGEGGILGQEEKEVLIPLLQNFSKKTIKGPLSPDSAFLKKNWRNYSFFVCLYHDQGLIPFKTAHAHTGFAQTLGLDFLRLSVSHGTGEDLKTEREISSKSFFSALKEAIRLCKKS